MLRKINACGVADDNGFSIQMDREVLYYVDEDRKMIFNMGYS